MTLPALPPANVQLVSDLTSGLEAVIVIHSTRLGPAAGGCRLWAYPDCSAMTVDACRLAEGMSYKNALAGLPLGGGKSVIRKPPGEFDRQALFRAFGRAVGALGGRYITAEDVGTSTDDMAIVRSKTTYVAGLPIKGDKPGGDPSPWTARGVFLSMKLAAERRLERPLSDCTVAIQGVGHVGTALALMLHEVGANLIVSDTDAQAAARVAVATGATIASVSSILSARADIFAPCALGGALNASSIKQLRARVVCGAANNQLGEAVDGNRLADAGVLYAPDYVVNAGGIINVAAEYFGWSPADASARVEAIPSRLAQVLDHAELCSFAPHAAADQLARELIAGGPAIPLVAAA